MTDAPNSLEPVAKVRVTHGGYGMTLAQHIAYALPDGDHWLYAHPDPKPADSQLVEVVEPLLRFHETGGHEGDGSDERLAAIREALAPHLSPSPSDAEPTPFG